MDEKNINISKSEEELLEIMENRSHITADQLHNLKEDEESRGLGDVYKRQL